MWLTRQGLHFPVPLALDRAIRLSAGRSDVHHSWARWLNDRYKKSALLYWLNYARATLQPQRGGERWKRPEASLSSGLGGELPDQDIRFCMSKKQIFIV